MPYKKAYNKPMYKKSKDKKQDKRLSTLTKKVNNLYQVEHRTENVEQTAFAKVYLGKASTNTIDELGYAKMLTNMAEGFGPAGRRSSKVKFTRLQGRINIIAPNEITLATGGINQMRASIVRVAQMPGAPATRTLPTIREVYTNFSGSITACHISDYLSQEQDMKHKNYTIVWDKRFNICPAGVSKFPCGKKAHTGIQYLGTGIDFQLEWDLKLDGKQTTFDDTTSGTDDCDQNHYILVIWNEYLVVSNVSLYGGKVMSKYICLA